MYTADDFNRELPFHFEYNGREVDDSIPEEPEIVRALFRISSRKLPGLSKFSVDILKAWYKQDHPRKNNKVDK